MMMEEPKWLDDLIAVITRTPLPRSLPDYKVASSLVLTTTLTTIIPTFSPSTRREIKCLSSRHHTRCTATSAKALKSPSPQASSPLVSSPVRTLSLSFLSLYSSFLYETRTGITLSASMLAVPPLFPAASAASTLIPANENLLARQWARLYNTGKMVAPPLAATSALSLFYAAYAHWYV